jgi:beta-glucosidase
VCVSYEQLRAHAQRLTYPSGWSPGASLCVLEATPFSLHPTHSLAVSARPGSLLSWVVSDCGAITNIATKHNYVKTTAEAAAIALTAGCDFECDDVFNTLPGSIASGLYGVSEANVDTALYRSVSQQLTLGVYDDPARSPWVNLSGVDVDSAAHRQLAREAAQQSAVLLANVGSVLPLDLSKIKTIAVLGPSANDTAGYNRCWDAGGGGCLYSHIYRGYSSFITTPLAGIQAAAAAAGVDVVFAAGVSDRTGNDTSGVAAAVALAASADAVIVVVGLDEALEEEGTDRMAPNAESYPRGNGLYQLPGVQQVLIDAVAATGTPVVEVLINGGPLSLVPPPDAPKFAILEAFYGAQACGDAIADLVFGVVSPSGRMPVTAYADPEQAGDIADMDMSKGRTYRYLPYSQEPTYPFGWGLSYTTFGYAFPAEQNTSRTISENTVVDVVVDLTNTGTVSAAEVVQVYASLAADFRSSGGVLSNISGHVPPRQLVVFDKVFVKAGDTATVRLSFVPNTLAAWNLWHLPRVVLHLAVGGVSPTNRTLPNLLTTSFTVLRE